MLCLLPTLPFSYFIAQIFPTHLITFKGGISTLPCIPSSSHTWAVLMALVQIQITWSCSWVWFLKKPWDPWGQGLTCIYRHLPNIWHSSRHSLGALNPNYPLEPLKSFLKISHTPWGDSLGHSPTAVFSCSATSGAHVKNHYSHHSANTGETTHP